ncbi:MAG: hypothetical protein GX442_09430 [Candidatus Riflebacteria bacterium]|nr:hypothetical protein [Candidatus Riflebacteria bacterium]
MTDMKDEFLSEEDLDLKSLTLEELDRAWTAWLLQAQATNDRDANEYSHGVFSGMDLTQVFWPEKTTPTTSPATPASLDGPAPAPKAASPRQGN